jgi:hypothetical protein
MKPWTLAQTLPFFGIFVTAVFQGVVLTMAFGPSYYKTKTTQGHRRRLDMVQEIQVCGFKDCHRAGGGTRLQKLVTLVRVCVCVWGVWTRFLVSQKSLVSLAYMFFCWARCRFQDETWISMDEAR